MCINFIWLFEYYPVVCTLSAVMVVGVSLYAFSDIKLSDDGLNHNSRMVGLAGSKIA